MSTAPDSDAPAGEAPRPDVLGYPSPTTSRYLILAVALLASGLFVGNWLHNQVAGDEWVRTVIACEQRRGGGTTFEELLREQEEFNACTAEVETTRTAFSVSGTLAAAAFALVLLYASPVVVRRRRRLRELGPNLAGAGERFAMLADEAGVAGRVRPLIGTSQQRDAFSFGAPGRYAVALPPAAAVRWRDPRLFDPVVRHELAHARQRDIALAWLTRSVWYALVPILAIPVVSGVASGDLSLVGDYVWRAILLGVVVALLSASLLRSREYGADLRAARWQGDPGEVEAVVMRARTGRTDLVSRLLAKHPAPQQRVAVLRDPALVTRAGFVDGLVGAFLGGLTVPLIVSALSPFLSGSGQSTRGYLFASLVLGPVLGASVGFAVWRAALFSKVAGVEHHVGGVAAGVGVGLVAGQAVSLGQTTAGLTAGLSQPAWLLVSVVAGAGTVVISSGLAQAWAQAAPRLSGMRACWVVALVVNAVVFSVLLWSTSLFQVAADGGGWALARSELTFDLAQSPMYVIVLALGVAALLPTLARQTDTVPGWLVEDPTGRPWHVAPSGVPGALLVAVVSGVVAAGTIVAYRLAAGAAPSDAASFDRFLAYQWVVAFGAASAACVLVVRDPGRGPALALVGVPVTAAVGSAGWFVLNLSLGGSFDLEVGWEMLRPATVLGWYLTLVVAPFAYVAGRQLPLPAVRRTAWAVAAAGVLSLVVCGMALQQRHGLVAPAAPDASALEKPLPVGTGTAAASYLIDVVPRLTQEYAAIDQAAQSLLANPTLGPADRADALDQQVVPAIAVLLDEWGGFSSASDEVTQAHAIAVTALRTADQKYRVLSQALRTLDPDGLAQAQQLNGVEAGLWVQWQTWQDTLAGGE